MLFLGLNPLYRCDDEVISSLCVWNGLKRCQHHPSKCLKPSLLIRCRLCRSWRRRRRKQRSSLHHRQTDMDFIILQVSFPRDGLAAAASHVDTKKMNDPAGSFWRRDIYLLRAPTSLWLSCDNLSLGIQKFIFKDWWPIWRIPFSHGQFGALSQCVILFSGMWKERKLVCGRLVIEVIPGGRFNYFGSLISVGRRKVHLIGKGLSF